ncbi:C39 family peptidase [Alicyclobacillus sp. ALC3]|uniref:C39 family peptidase n=1 Tax=Alicyclobacillus sp. ALC3 TaxID=2796143 RepID=UPI002378F13F|nr:C39 family peptidase [Alicyclobacillus sp. ALC3]
MQKLRSLNATRKNRRHQAAVRRRHRRRLVATSTIVVLGFAGWASSGWWLPTAKAKTELLAAAQTKHNSTSPLEQKRNTAKPKVLTKKQSGTTPKQNSKPTESELPASVMLNVPPQNQNPQLPNGCEVTSLSMLFTAIGNPVSKMTLAAEQPYDSTPRVESSTGQIISWGNPNVGFVGSPYVWSDGFGIYHGPIIKLIDKILPGEGVDLTNQPFDEILSYVAKGVPVEAWVTATLKPTNKYWETWQTPEGPIRVNEQEHAVLIVGYNAKYIFINNPLTGQKDEPVKRANFLGAWNELGNQAVTIAVHGSTSDT